MKPVKDGSENKIIPDNLINYDKPLPEKQRGVISQIKKFFGDIFSVFNKDKAESNIKINYEKIKSFDFNKMEQELKIDLDKMVADVIDYNAIAKGKDSHGNIKSQEAEKKLAGREPGSYLIRESLSLRKKNPGSIAISYVDENKNVKHIRLKYQNKKFVESGKIYSSVSEYIEQRPGFKKLLTPYDTKETFKTNLDEKTLKKIKDKVIKELNKSEGIPVKVKIKELHSLPLIVSKKISKSGEEKIYFTDIDQRQKLGEGSYGIVSVVQKLCLDSLNNIKITEKVLKNPKKEMEFLDAGADLKNEGRLLKAIHAKERVVGIQKAPYGVYQVGKEQAIGIMGKKYDGDLASQCKKYSIEEKINGFYQMLCGLAHCEQIGLRHGDIKPENILTERKQNGRVVFDIADFGGAKFYNEIESPLDCAYTSSFFPSGDRDRIIDLEKKMEELAEPEKKEVKQQLRALGEKVDVFAMGRSMYEVMTLESNLPNIGEDRPTLPKDSPEIAKFQIDLKNKLAEKGCPNDISEIIIAMMHPNPEERPKASDAKRQFMVAMHALNTI